MVDQSSLVRQTARLTLGLTLEDEAAEPTRVSEISNRIVISEPQLGQLGEQLNHRVEDSVPVVKGEAAHEFPPRARLD